MIDGNSTVRASVEETPAIATLFPDLHPPLTRQAAMLEAHRCLNCFDAPCTTACPTHIDVPRFIKKLASGNVQGSALGILEANVLASSCSRVCPVEVLCEGVCVMHHQQQRPIAIGRLQQYAMDWFDSTGGTLPTKATQEHTGRVACIGAGPASLAAAAELRQQGLQVVVFDKKRLPGGLNTYGVAEYKLSVRASLREIDRIAQLGVEFRYGVELNDESEIGGLEASFDAIFLGVGLGSMHRLAIPGGDHPGVLDALGFIEDYKLGKTTSVEGRVVVIGAGNTAIDAAIAAKRLGAQEVRILYRRTEEQVSAFESEYKHARQEGILFDWLTQSVAVHADRERIQALECVLTRSNNAGDLTPILGSNMRISCNLVIPAIGQAPLIHFLSKCRGVVVDQGRVVIDRRTGQTTSPKYFAGGDCVNGGREVVDAVADGKRAGQSIAKLLLGVPVG